MIVGTEGPDIMEDQDQDQNRDQGETKETSSEQGETAGDGGTGAAQQAQTQPVQTQPAQQGGGGGGGGPKDPTTDILKSLARAEAMKSLEGPAADLYSPEKEKARKDLEAAYKKALEDNGDLRVKLKKAQERFDRAAADMFGDRLNDWLKLFDKSGPLGTILTNRKTYEDEYLAKLGDNEKARDDSQVKSKRWADTFASWSSPVEKMTAIIGEYADKIDKLNADINNNSNRNSAMLSFWLEVAPKHLQLATQPLADANAQKAVDQVAGVLKNYALEKKLMNGKARNDGSLYVTKNIGAARRYVLRKWIEAAKAQADAEALFKQKPDDAASRKQRWDKLKDDSWLKEAEPVLETNGG